jgi:hypothetical protein
MKALVGLFQLTVDNGTDAEVADAISGLLTENGTHATNPKIKDWAYVGGQFNAKRDQNTATVEVIILAQPGVNGLEFLQAVGDHNTIGVRLVFTPLEIEVPDNYNEGDFAK